MKISCIAACAKDRIIGKDGKIPWFITGEQQRFKELTTGHVVIMGRKTYDEIAAKLGGPLPNRKTIVISSSHECAAGDIPSMAEVSDSVGLPKPAVPGLWYATSPEQALDIAAALVQSPDEEVFIAGGESVYRAFIGLSETLYLTEIDACIDGDTRFPEFDENLWKRTVESEHQAEYRYCYVTWKR